MPVDTLTVRKRSVHGTMREVFADIGLDAAYPAGGEALTAAQLNQLMPEYGGALTANDSGKIEFFQSEPRAGGVIVLNRATGKLMVFAGGAEAGATDQSAAARCRIAYDVGSGI